jgi:hypothetical protein
MGADRVVLRGRIRSREELGEFLDGYSAQLVS